MPRCRSGPTAGRRRCGGAQTTTCASPMPIRTPAPRVRSAGPLARTLEHAAALRRRHAGGRGRGCEPGRRSPTSGARASSATATASSTPPAFRRLAGKTQVFVFPDDHQRTRLTHALEVAQVATAVARALGPQRRPHRGDRPRPRLRPRPGRPRQRGRPVAVRRRAATTTPSGAPTSRWRRSTCASRRSTASATTRGADRRPSTPEGEVVSWADRIAYVCHDFEDAVAAGIVGADMLPAIVAERCGADPVAPARRVHHGDGRGDRRRPAGSG